MCELHRDHSRFVFNLALEQANCYTPRRGPAPSSAERMRQLTEARAHSEWLAAGSTVVQQGALRDFDRAMSNWWAGIENGTHAHRRPTWRRKGVHEGFVVRDLSLRRINRKFGEVWVPKAGWVRFRLTCTWSEIEACTSARVTFDRAGRWWVPFTCLPPAFERTPTGAVVGIDRGVTNTVALSNGEMDSIPSWTPGEQTRFLALEHRLARQEKGSNRRAATRTTLARLYARLADRRSDWVEQTSTRLVRDDDLIAIERLDTEGMTRRPRPKPDGNTPGAFLPNGARAKAALNRAVLGSCWGELERRLDDETTQSGTSVLVRVDPRNTSRRCSACGHTAKNNRESQADFACQSCGHEEHADTNADTNAAIDIRDAALATLLGSTEVCGRADRERMQKSQACDSQSGVNHPAAA